MYKDIETPIICNSQGDINCPDYDTICKDCPAYDYTKCNKDIILTNMVSKYSLYKIQDNGNTHLGIVSRSFLLNNQMTWRFEYCDNKYIAILYKNDKKTHLFITPVVTEENKKILDEFNISAKIIADIYVLKDSSGRKYIRAKHNDSPIIIDRNGMKDALLKLTPSVKPYKCNCVYFRVSRDGTLVYRIINDNKLKTRLKVFK